ncbi:MAG: HigA family addiction module antidote protein [Parcubacteria group bacterium]|nr:HigA family addiction module antidote protein [Parcubacteria group bacterium]
MTTTQTKEIIGWVSPTAIHPGEFLEETLEEYSLSQAELSERIGISKKVINEIVKGKNPITSSTAYKLSKVFPISPDYWINLQKSYEADKARIEETARLTIEGENFLPRFKETYKELSLIGCASGLKWTQKTFGEITSELQKFFGVDSLAYVEHKTMQFAFRKYERDNLNPYTLAAWLRIGKNKAQKVETAPFSEDKLKAMLQELRSLSLKEPEEYLPKIEKLLAVCGVAAAYAPKMKNTHVQGACSWVAKDKVLLMLNTSKRNEGNFWFNLFHELGHVLLHSKKEVFVDMEHATTSDIEKEADTFAQKWLIPDFKNTHNKFIQRMTSGSLEKAVEETAKEEGISTAILAGRLTNEYKSQPNIYKLMSKFLPTKIDCQNVC